MYKYIHHKIDIINSVIIQLIRKLALTHPPAPRHSRSPSPATDAMIGLSRPGSGHLLAMRVPTSGRTSGRTSGSSFRVTLQNLQNHTIYIGASCSEAFRKSDNCTQVMMLVHIFFNNPIIKRRKVP